MKETNNQIAQHGQYANDGLKGKWTRCFGASSYRLGKARPLQSPANINKISE